MKKIALIMVIAVLAFTLFSGEAETKTEKQTLRILVTNDDGIDSPGIRALALALSEIAEVTVSAPEENCSGVSHSSKIFSGEYRAKLVDIPGAQKAWAIEGLPSDAVTWGVFTEGQEQPFDFVVSGINGGPNVGEIAHYSGTIGAGMEGVGLGIPSIAVSQSRQKDYALACKVTVDLVQRLVKEGAPLGILWAIEVPKIDADSEPVIAIAPMGGRYVKIVGFNTKENAGGEGLTFRSQLEFPSEAPEGSSTEAFMAGKVVITPLLFDWSANEEIKRMQAWE
ncbi:MAG: 5'-nucleotidase [Myxococcota bacterium]|jgi:5'-nucleotidase